MYEQLKKLPKMKMGKCQHCQNTQENIADGLFPMQRCSIL
jgi:hypothetical protein